MREALIRLANERYIDILPNRGFKIHSPSRSDIEEAYHMRCALESHCAGVLAHEHDSLRGKAAIAEMQSWLNKQVELQSSMDLPTFWQYDLEFHTALIRFLDVPSFYQQFETFMHFFSATQVEDYISTKRDISSIQEHQSILDALSSGDVPQTMSAVRKHMLETLHASIKRFC